jgi:hypothetical protein
VDAEGAFSARKILPIRITINYFGEALGPKPIGETDEEGQVGCMGTTTKGFFFSGEKTELILTRYSHDD